ncbi:uncharacterized protein PG986_013798 [Apiospora aurea]|uniref:Uncharacterized protein n=1 Tax=Apiospora aurea TaxID=335848 RepID=A0ABR1PWK9_9PEZI
MSDESTTLGSFPLEIWSHICAQLADEISQAPSLRYRPCGGGPSLALMALCRVSKGVSQEAARVLFRSLDSTWDWGDAKRDALRRHLRYLRFALDHPHVLSYVKEVFLSDRVMHDDEKTYELVAEIYCRLASRLGFNPAAFPLEGKDGDFSLVHNNVRTLPDHVKRDALLFLALPLFPNIQALTISGTNCLTVLPPLRAAGITKPFESIVDLTLGWDYHVRYNKYGHYNDSQHFPRNVKSLDIDKCHFNYGGMSDLLRRCPRLERFVYRSAELGDSPLASVFHCQCRDPNVREREEEVSKRDLVDALRSVRTTLKEADLTFQLPRPRCEPGEQVTRADFAGFPVLETLRVRDTMPAFPYPL